MIALRRKRRLAGEKALADDLRRGGDDHESVRVVRVDEAAKRQRLCAGENGDDHRFALVVERAVDVLKRRAAVQIDGDEVDDRIHFFMRKLSVT